MYGLLQSGIISNKLLKERLQEYGYDELPDMPGLFKHKTRPVWFSLVVEDFGIKHIGKENAKYIIYILKDFYEVKVETITFQTQQPPRRHRGIRKWCGPPNDEGDHHEL